MAVFNNILAGAAGASAGAGGYQIERSLRFNSADSAYLNRTPSSSGNRRTWTWAGWVKLSKEASGSGSDQPGLFGASNSDTNNRFRVFFQTPGQLRIEQKTSGSTLTLLVTNQIWRDFSAWGHLVISCDTTQATTNDRMRIYWNGTRVTGFSTETYQNQNTDTFVNSTVSHSIGRTNDIIYYFNGYLADIHFIDGQALDPTDFGEFDDNDVWQPIEYTGSYGTNGFHLDFADNSTATALGTDTSGAGNDWTVNNLTATSGTVYTDDLVLSGTMYPGTALGNAFDGNTSTTAQLTNSAQNQTLTFTPTGGIAYSSSVEVFLFPTGNVAVTRYSVNGGSDQSFSSGAGYKTILSGSGTLTSFVLKQGAQSNSAGFSAIRIDGTTILVDGAPAKDIDSLVDSPQNGTQTDTGAGGEVSGNYCTWNPLKQTSGTYSNGNLQIATSSGNKHYQATFGLTSGKWYWEVTPTTGSTPGMIGIALDSKSLSSNLNGDSAMSYYSVTGHKQGGNTSGVDISYGATYTYGDVIGVALDLDSATTTLTFYKNGSSQGVAFNPDPALGSWHPAVSAGSSVNTTTFVANFGQRPFAYSAPSGYKALCTANLDDPTIADSSTYFTTITYSGNSGDGLSTTQDIVTGFSPDMVWIKHRNGTNSNVIFDTIRGAGKRLFTNSTNSETTKTQTLSTFNNNGFTLNGDNSVNDVGGNYVAWNWDAGTSTASNTNGTITSSVRANPSAGFSIVKYTGQSGGGSWGHGLNVAPEFIIFKRYTASQNWFVWTRESDGTYLEFEGLNNTRAAYSSRNNVSATSTTVTLATFAEFNSDPGSNYIAYCWVPVEGYSAFGSYTGNGIADGPFVYTGFRPRWVLFKTSTETEATNTAWYIYDAARLGYNGDGNNKSIKANTTDAEANAGTFDLLSNGFKLRNNNGGLNTNNATYIYAAFAEHPFKTARAR